MSNTQTASPFQQDIYDFIENGKGHALVNAVAGSGKSTTIKNSLNFIPNTKKIIFLAFNVAIVEELKAKLPSYVQVKTSHSFGWSCIRNYRRTANKDDFKVSKLAKLLATKWVDDEDVYEYSSKLKRLVDLIRSNVVYNALDLELVAKKHDIVYERVDLDRAFEVFNTTSRNLNDYDFADMIYMPATNHNIPVDQFDFVFVDECQDLNKAQQLLIQRMLVPDTGRIIAVGDPGQAIYGFAGSDAESFTSLGNIPNTTILPLSVCYRCGKKIIELAKTIVPQIEAAPNAPDGSVNFGASIKEVIDGDYVICRNTAPLVQLCLQFLRENRKAYIKGSDIGKNIIALVKKSKKNTYESLIKWLRNELQNIFIDLEDANSENGLTSEQLKEIPAYRLFAEKVMVIECIGDNDMSIKTSADLIAKIETIFQDKSTGIVLSTIHKSKGLEADRVFILEKNLMPSKYAKQPWQKEQERNLEYVAYTRAKSYLGFISDWSSKPSFDYNTKK